MWIWIGCFRYFCIMLKWIFYKYWRLNLLIMWEIIRMVKWWIFWIWWRICGIGLIKEVDLSMLGYVVKKNNYEVFYKFIIGWKKLVVYIKFWMMVKLVSL